MDGNHRPSTGRRRRRRRSSATSTDSIGNAEEIPDAEAISLLPHFPALPKGDRWKRVAETVFGLLCHGVGLACVVIIHDLLRTVGSARSLQFRRVVLGVVYCQFCLTISCHAYVLLGPRGAIRRKRSNCLPIPLPCAEHLKARMARAELSTPDATEVPALPRRNLARYDSGQTYCVRCLVWRNPPSPAPACLPLPGGRRFPCPGVCEPAESSELHPHHCSTCGHCVQAYDHHCALLGRCITPTNLLAFKGLLTFTATGLLTTLILFLTLRRGSQDDASADCPTWAHAGECSANPAYMLQSCAASCSKVGL